MKARLRRGRTAAALTALVLLGTACSGPSARPTSVPVPETHAAASPTRRASPLATATPTPIATTSAFTSASATSPPDAPGSTGSADELRTAFAALPDAGSLSVAVVAVGSAGEPILLGDQGAPVAWSTAKVPLAIAVERTSRAEALRPTMRQAITASDNDAALALWRSLGAADAAGRATDQVLRDFGDATTATQTEQVRPPYTPFGQTRWSVGDQARFTGHLPCRAEAAPVLAAMGQVISDQRWGLGRIAGARFKGGWGPSSRGYLVRQLGVIDTPRGQVAVAISTDAGSFDEGTAVLTRAAEWLQSQQDHLPAGHC